MINKELYRQRRKDGLRGQDTPYIDGRGIPGSQILLYKEKPVSKKALLKNTKRARKLAAKTQAGGETK